MAQPKVVLKASEALGGAPMQRNPGVRDRKLVYPETGFPTRSLVMGIVEVDPGCRAPAHRHNCEEVYYVLGGRGEVISDGVPHAFEAGDAVYNAPNSVHTVRNTGAERLRLLVVGGIMFVGLVPRWPTQSPYEILDDGEYLAELSTLNLTVAAGWPSEQVGLLVVELAGDPAGDLVGNLLAAGGGGGGVGRASADGAPADGPLRDPTGAAHGQRAGGVRQGTWDAVDGVAGAAGGALAELGFADLAAYLRERHAEQGWLVKRMQAELQVGRRGLVGELARLGLRS